MPTTPLKIGLIGAGHMGSAIAKALLAQGIASSESLLCCDADKDRAAASGGRIASLPELLSEVDVAIVAVRPQDLAGLLESIARIKPLRPLFLSIAAGKTTTWIEERLPGARVIRAMPNLGFSVGAGASAYAAGKAATEEDLATADALLKACGVTMRLEEAQLDAVTALSGSGPAFFAFALQAMIKGGVALGLAEDAASALALQTMLGTALVLSRSGAPSVSAFIDSVCSKGGTTEAGMATLRGSSVEAAFADCLAAASRRAGELSKS